ncbi:MAG: hypothetical protein KGR17_05445 [Acidobacteria bacterium]|nr:hypothetical protein [Acidobacteriota bacterium]
MNAPTCSPTSRSTRTVARRATAPATAFAGTSWPSKPTAHEGNRFGRYPGHRSTRRGGTPH